MQRPMNLFSSAYIQSSAELIHFHAFNLDIIFKDKDLQTYITNQNIFL